MSWATTPTIDDAVKDGFRPYDQAQRAWDLATRCHQRCDKIGDLGAKLDCDNGCKAMEARALWFDKHADAIEKALDNQFKPMPAGQNASDRLYTDVYTANTGKSADDLDAQISEVIDEIHTQGLTPARRARLDALNDRKMGAPFNPPIYDPDARHGPTVKPSEEPEQPET